MHRLSTILALLLVSSVALADGHGDKDKDKDHGRGKPSASGEAHRADPKGDAGTKAHDDDDDDDGPATDGGKPAGRLTPAQLNFRKETWERREKAIEARVHKGGKKMSEAEREAVKKHWLVLGKLLRIRELAQEDKNDAAVKRVDALIEKLEKKLDAKLETADGGAK